MSIELMIASNHLILCHCVNFYNKWWLSWTRDRLVRGLVIISTTKAYPRGSGTKHSEAVCDLNEGKEKEDAFNCVFWLFPASHALESYTALPYHMRSPCPSSPITRPAYQGSNPISDIWAAHALRIVAKYLKRYVVEKGQKQGKKKPVSTFMKCGSLDPEMSWASLFTQKSSHCAYRSTRDQQPLEGAPRGQMKTRSLDLERQSPGWGQHGSLIYKGCS